MDVNVSVYGSSGSFTEDAALRYFATGGEFANISTRPSAHLDGLFGALIKKESQFAVVPFENSVSGLLMNVLIKIIESPTLHIVGEVVVPEEHCLCALPGTKKEDIRTVLSHDHLLQQSDKYINSLEKENGGHAIHRQRTFDSTEACALVDSPTKAAIASRRAGLNADLEVIGSRIADLECETRYLVLALKPAPASNRLGLRCAVSFLLPNQHGAMFRSMSCFACECHAGPNASLPPPPKHTGPTHTLSPLTPLPFRAPPAPPTPVRNLNITKITSVPLGGKKGSVGGTARGSPLNDEFVLGKWDYMFVVEFSASTDPAVNEAALSNLREFAAKVRILGEFPSAESTAERALKTKRSYEQLTCGF